MLAGRQDSQNRLQCTELVVRTWGKRGNLSSTRLASPTLSTKRIRGRPESHGVVKSDRDQQRDPSNQYVPENGHGE